MNKVLGRKGYRIIQLINKLPKPPFVETVTVKDFTSGKEYEWNKSFPQMKHESL